MGRNREYVLGTLFKNWRSRDLPCAQGVRRTSQTWENGGKATHPAQTLFAERDCGRSALDSGVSGSIPASHSMRTLSPVPRSRAASAPEKIGGVESYGCVGVADRVTALSSAFPLLSKARTRKSYDTPSVSPATVAFRVAVV